MADNDGMIRVRFKNGTSTEILFSEPTFRDWKREPGCLVLNFTDRLEVYPWDAIVSINVQKNSGDSFRPVRLGALRQEDGHLSQELALRLRMAGVGHPLVAMSLLEEFLRIGPVTE